MDALFYFCPRAHIYSMANYYRILSAFSASGENLQIPIHWDFDKLSDISVVVAGSDGKASHCDYWSWNSQLNQIEIENTKNYAEWAAYVSRKEDASTLLQLVEGFVVNAQNIVEQFKKTNRVIEALQEDFKTSIRAPDYIGGILPNAAGRKGRFLSFDESGNPNCDIGTDEFNDASTSTHMAMAAAQEAAQGAQESFEKAAEAQEAAEISKSGAQAAQSEASQYAKNAQTSAEQASVSAKAAESAKTQSQGYAEEAETIVSDGLEAVQAARDSALQDIEVYTDPDGRISNLDKTTAKRGELWFNGGSISVLVPEWGTTPFSFAFFYKKTAPWVVGYVFDKSPGPGGNANGLTIFSSSRATIIRFMLRTGINSGYGTSINAPISAVPTDGKWHSVVWTVPGVDVETWRVFVDGIQTTKTVTKGTFSGDFLNSNPLKINPYSEYNDISMAQILVAKFDMSAADAVYSVADYANGIEPSPKAYQDGGIALKLADYTIRRNASTQLVKDFSGNANDGTITGSVIGRLDNEIAAVFDELKTQINQQNG